jgi:hypothetical protein
VRPTLYTVERPGLGRLSIMARPRGGDWLAEEMRDLFLAGVGILISTLTPIEASSLDLGDEADAAAAPQRLSDPSCEVSPTTGRAAILPVA